MEGRDEGGDLNPASLFLTWAAETPPTISSTQFERGTLLGILTFR